MLSATAAHAVRALLCLTRQPTDTPVLARQLSACAQVPMSYLSKILATLARAGILQAARGVNGGYRLARPAAEVTLFQVVELFDGPQSHATCLLGPLHSCCDEDPCPAHERWRAVRDRYLEFLRTVTFDQLRGPLPWVEAQPGGWTE